MKIGKQALYEMVLPSLKNNGSKEAALRQILDRQYMEPFKADKREVIGLGIELDDEGKGLLDFKYGKMEKLKD